MARRGTRVEQYQAIAGYFGGALVEGLSDPRIPDFVLVHEARRAAHYALTALAIEEKRRRKPGRRASGLGDHPALPAAVTAAEGAILS